MKKCKVCGFVGPMALNRRKNETDTCPACMKKYKRMQSIYYEYIKPGRASYEKIKEYNELVAFLWQKTNLKPVDVASANASTGVRGITKEVNPFKLYAAMPKEVLKDRSFYTFDSVTDNKETDKRYPDSMCCLMDTVLLCRENDYSEVDVEYKQYLKLDINSWVPILQNYYYDHATIIDDDKELKEFNAYHWLCYIYKTFEETVQMQKLSVPATDYMLYAFDMFKDDIVRK